MDAGVEVGESASGLRRYWTAQEERQIVEQTLSSTLSVAMVAREHGVNANQVFYWRKLYRKRTGFPSSESAASGLKIAAWFMHRKLSPNVEFADGDRFPKSVRLCS